MHLESFISESVPALRPKATKASWSELYWNYSAASMQEGFSDRKKEQLVDGWSGRQLDESGVAGASSGPEHYSHVNCSPGQLQNRRAKLPPRRYIQSNPSLEGWGGGDGTYRTAHERTPLLDVLRHSFSRPGTRATLLANNAFRRRAPSLPSNGDWTPVNISCALVWADVHRDAGDPENVARAALTCSRHRVGKFVHAFFNLSFFTNFKSCVNDVIVDPLSDRRRYPVLLHLSNVPYTRIAFLPCPPCARRRLGAPPRALLPMARAVVYAAATWELGLHVTASLSYYHTSAASASLRCARRASLNDWERLWAPPYWMVISSHSYGVARTQLLVLPIDDFRTPHTSSSSPRVHGFASHCARQQLERAVWDARVLLKSTPENAATCYLLNAPAQGDDAYAARPWAVVYPAHVRVLAPARRPLSMQHDQLMLAGFEPPPLQAIPAVLWMSRRPCPGSHVPRHCARTAARRDGCWRRAGCWTAWMWRSGADALKSGAGVGVAQQRSAPWPHAALSRRRDWRAGQRARSVHAARRVDKTVESARSLPFPGEASVEVAAVVPVQPSISSRR
ncbi:hypothetical protein GGX14DRAFT_405701 [Mycena pura]|uniref:Uncharacterized protein n=1 Tax=Mycena pura TaxID=153505 RepID=A0AAD6US08_9AGAR|nr:hypothetical protein GGX14DRAFT_405701 [Mycena pura]